MKNKDFQTLMRLLKRIANRSNPITEKGLFIKNCLIVISDHALLGIALEEFDFSETQKTLKLLLIYAMTGLFSKRIERKIERMFRANWLHKTILQHKVFMDLAILVKEQKI